MQTKLFSTQIFFTNLPCLQCTHDVGSILNMYRFYSNKILSHKIPTWRHKEILTTRKTIVDVVPVIQIWIARYLLVSCDVSLPVRPLFLSLASSRPLLTFLKLRIERFRDPPSTLSRGQQMEVSAVLFSLAKHDRISGQSEIMDWKVREYICWTMSIYHGRCFIEICQEEAPCGFPLARVWQNAKVNISWFWHNGSTIAVCSKLHHSLSQS